MKTFNEKHESIITSEWVEVNDTKDVKEGEIVLHKLMVDTVKIYENTYGIDGYPNGVRENIISRQFIIDMYEEITELEKEVKDLPYCNLPF